MTGTDLYKRAHKSVPVIFEPPCILRSIFGNFAEIYILFSFCSFVPNFINFMITCYSLKNHLCSLDPLHSSVKMEIRKRLPYTKIKTRPFPSDLLLVYPSYCRHFSERRI